MPAVVRKQAFHRGLGEALRWRVELQRRSAQETFGQSRYVVAALAQRRQVQAHHIEAMQQVGAEAAFGDQCVEVLVCGRDHAHVDSDQLAATDAEELALDSTRSNRV